MPPVLIMVSRLRQMVNSCLSHCGLHSIHPAHPQQPGCSLPLRGRPCDFCLSLDSEKQQQETERWEERGLIFLSPPWSESCQDVGVMGFCLHPHPDALTSLPEAPTTAHDLLIWLNWIQFPSRTVMMQTLWRKYWKRKIWSSFSLTVPRWTLSFSEIPLPRGTKNQRTSAQLHVRIPQQKCLGISVPGPHPQSVLLLLIWGWGDPVWLSIGQVDRWGSPGPGHHLCKVFQVMLTHGQAQGTLS